MFIIYLNLSNEKSVFSGREFSAGAIYAGEVKGSNEKEKKRGRKKKLITRPEDRTPPFCSTFTGTFFSDHARMF